MTNNKIKVLIVDDEEPARKLIASFLAEHDDFEVIGECADGFNAIKQINELQPDLVFLDIQMPKLTGMEVIELLENPPLIAFITAYDEFAVKAFEMNAIDYLLKPYSKQRFNDSLTKFKEKFALKTDNKATYQKLTESISENKFIERLAVKTGTKIEVVNVENIEMFEAQDDYVQIYTDKGKYLKNITMKYLEDHLDSEVFARIHRSYIVNLNCIEKIERAEKDTFFVILKNSHSAKASKAGYSLIKEKLNL